MHKQQVQDMKNLQQKKRESMEEEEAGLSQGQKKRKGEDGNSQAITGKGEKEAS